MDLWYSEFHTKNVKLSIKVSSELVSEQSRFQHIAVFDSPEFGRFLTLDGVMMLTERDEFIYHEMITHVPMSVNPDIKTVLVIGAGDGGVLRELGKYKTIEKIDLVEIDEQVIEVCKKYLPQTACGFDNEKANVIITDGIKYLRNIEKNTTLLLWTLPTRQDRVKCFFPKNFTATVITL